MWDYLSKKRRNDMLSYMPGPKTLPILGNVLMYRGQSPEGKFYIDLVQTIVGCVRGFLTLDLLIFCLGGKCLNWKLSSISVSFH